MPASDTADQVAPAKAGATFTYARLSPGDPAPSFVQRSPQNPRFASTSLGGFYTVFCFLGSAADAQGARAVEVARRRQDLFDARRAAFFGVSLDPADEARLRSDSPGISFFWDFDGSLAKSFGALQTDWSPGAPILLRRRWVVVDPQQRVHAVIAFCADGGDVDEVMRVVAAAPAPGWSAGFEAPPPVLVITNVFEPELCSALIAFYGQAGGETSGFMREVDGRTVRMHDPAHKVRSDVLLPDGPLKLAVRDRLHRRVRPEIHKAHQFEVTRMERYLIGCYSAAAGGHFHAHRDNTTRGTAHRRFAASVNLNADFDGGEVSFPEYGDRGFKPPPGAAVVFSCSLLHRVSPVVRGERYAFLPFLYDEAAAALRDANRAFVDV